MSSTAVGSTYSTATGTRSATAAATANQAEGVTPRDEVAQAPAPSDIPERQDDLGKNNTDDSSSAARQGQMEYSNHNTTKDKSSSSTNGDDDDPAAKKIGKPNYDGQVPLAYEKASSCSSSAKTRVDVAAAAAAAAAAATPASQDKDDKQKPAELHFLSPKSHIGRQQFTAPTDHEIKKGTDQANHHDDKKQPAKKLHFLNPNHPPAGASHPGTLFGGLESRYTSEEEKQEVQAMHCASNTDVNYQHEFQHELCDNDRQFIQLQQLRQAAVIMEEGLHQPGAFPDGPTGFNYDPQFAFVDATASNVAATLPSLSSPPSSFAAVEQPCQGSPNVNVTNDSPSLLQKYSDLAVAKLINDDEEYNPTIGALPMAEEFHPSKEKTNSTKRRRYLLIALGMGLLTAVAVTVALVITLSRHDTGHVGSSNVDPTNAGPSMADPTLAPTSPATYILTLLPQYTLDAIGMQESPQSKAFDWLMKDPLLDTHPDWRILQKFALATFFYATGGENSWIFKDNWLNHSVHECLWFFQDTFADVDLYVDLTFGQNKRIDVTELYQTNYSKPCEEEDISQNTSHGVVKQLRLWANQLDGTLPPELYLLTALNSLSIHANKELTGTISPLVGQLRSLKVLSIAVTDVSGTLPTEVGLLYNLTAMRVFSNRLSGAIPSQLGQITQLKELIMDSNNFTFSIPTELGQLTCLEYLLLCSNQLSSSIPTELGLTNLLWLLLFSNALTGSIPTELGLLTNIKDVEFDDNNLMSSIPTELGLLTNLEDLELFLNQLTSSIPTELGLLTKMSWLYLFDNALTGSIPTELGLLTNIKDLELDANNLTSSIPAELGLLTNLENLELFLNQLTFSIPTELGLLTKLSSLDLEANVFTGRIPTELGLLTDMVFVILSSNQLTSTLPMEIGQLTSLCMFHIEHNNLSGSIPSDVGLLSNVSLSMFDESFYYIGLRFADNLFEGKIPSEIGQLSSLPALWLQGNQLTGEVPQEVFALAVDGSLKTLNVTGNQLLSGSIPHDVCLVDGLDLAFDCSPMLCGCDCVCW